MHIIGVTGGIATGKSSVCKWFSDHHVPVIHADALCHELMKPGRPAYAKVVALLESTACSGVLDPSSGAIDRKQLGAIVFQNPEMKQRLEDILHPLAKREMLLRVLRCFLSGEPLVVLEVPLLFETRLDRFVTKSVVVDCPESLQMSRLLKRNPDLSHSDAQARIDSQLSMTVKKCMASVVIDNGQDWRATEAQLAQLMAKLETRWYETLFWPSLVYLPAIGALLYGSIKVASRLWPSRDAWSQPQGSAMAMAMAMIDAQDELLFPGSFLWPVSLQGCCKTLVFSMQSLRLFCIAWLVLVASRPVCAGGSSDPFSKACYDAAVAQRSYRRLHFELPSGYPADHIYQYREGYMAQRHAPRHLDILDGKLDGLYIYPTPLNKVRVYIVDHGLDIHHPGEFGCARAMPGLFLRLCMLEISGLVSMPYDPFGVTLESMEHGTRAASLVAGRISGVAKTVELVGIAVCDKLSKNATDREFREALEWVLSHAEPEVPSVAVVSMAADFYSDILSENIYKRFKEHNILLVFPPLSNRDSRVLTMHKRMQIESSICVGGLAGDFSFFGGPTQNNSDLGLVADNFMTASSQVNSHYFAYQASPDLTLAPAVVGGIAAAFLSRQSYTSVDLKSAVLALAKVNPFAPHVLPILSSYYHFFA